MNRHFRPRLAASFLAACVFLGATVAPVAAQNLPAPSGAQKTFVAPATPYPPIARATATGGAQTGQFATPDKRPKIEALLATIARTNREHGPDVALKAARDGGLTVVSSRVRVVVESVLGAGTSASSAAVLALGGTVEAEYAGLVQATVPVAALEALAAVAGVRRVRSPSRPQLLGGATTSEGVLAVNASTWQAAGITGAGVKIAIIDGGFAGLAARQATGDLPAVVTTDLCGGGFSTATDHGTAVAEIVYDTAPGAQLYLACVNSEVTLGLAKDWAKAQGVHIINNSMAWFDDSRGDGSGGPGSADATVADARASGVLWVAAAGNYAQNHWSGTWNDPDGNGLLNFSVTDQSNGFFAAPNATQCVFLKWDLWPTSNQDYDLFIGDPATAQIVASSTNDQSGFPQAPTETACVTNATPAFKQFDIIISRFSATASPRFDLFVPDAAGMQYTVGAGSIATPASSPSAFGVGAVCWQTSGLEPFSSLGPTIDGRTKPDLVGPDQVSTQTFGAFTGCGSFGGFAGTSASAPQAAAAAALVKQANPSFGPAQLQAFLTGRALDLTATGVDNQTGAGELWLGAPPSPAITANPPIGSTIALTGPTGVPTPRSISVTNTGASGSTLNINLATLSSGFSLTGAPLSLSSGTTGTLTVGCTQAVPVGALTLTTNDLAHVSVSYSLTCFPPLQAFSGSLPNGSAIALSGTAGIATTRSVGVTNGGQNGSTLTASVGTVSAGYSVTGGPLSLVQGSKGVFTIGCTPTIADGVLTLITNDPANLVVTYSLSCVTASRLQFHPLPSPVRLLDTRSGAGVSGCDIGAGVLPANGTRTEVAIGACTGIPSGARAIFGNSTAVAQSGSGFVTLFPSTVVTPPTVANVNYPANGTVNNVFTVGLGADGAFKVFTGSSPTHLVIDITGYFALPDPAGLYFHPLPTPVRLLDTRSGAGVSGCDIGAGLLAIAGTRTEVAVGTCTGIPAGARAIFGNSTAVAQSGSGFVTLFPSTVDSPPTVANVNYAADAVVNNAFTVGLGPDGAFKVFTGSSPTHLIVDVTGYYDTNATAGQLFMPLPTPVRLLDTRSGAGVSGCDIGAGVLAAGGTRVEPASGTCTGVPAEATAVVGNSTAVSVTTGGYVTLFPSSAGSVPTAANVNYPTGGIVNTAFTVGLGPDGAFKIFTGSSATDLVVDLTGAFVPDGL